MACILWSRALLGQGAASSRILLPTQGCSRADLSGPDSALSQVCGWAGLARPGGRGRPWPYACPALLSCCACLLWREGEWGVLMTGTRDDFAVLAHCKLFPKPAHGRSSQRAFCTVWRQRGQSLQSPITGHSSHCHVSQGSQVTQPCSGDQDCGPGQLSSRGQIWSAYRWQSCSSPLPQVLQLEEGTKTAWRRVCQPAMALSLTASGGEVLSPGLRSQQADCLFTGS